MNYSSFCKVGKKVKIKRHKWTQKSISEKLSKHVISEVLSKELQWLHWMTYHYTLSYNNLWFIMLNPKAMI